MTLAITTSNLTPAYAAEKRATVEQTEAAFAAVLAKIEGMPADKAAERRTASTLYVEALIAFRAENIDSAAVALHMSLFWATGRV